MVSQSHAHSARVRGNAPSLMYSLAAVGLVLGVLVLLGALMLRRMPARKKPVGLMVIAFSVPSVIMGGGLIAGFILGVVGGVSAVREKTIETNSLKIAFFSIKPSCFH